MSAPDRSTCDDVFRRLDRYLDRTLDPEELRLVQEHLETCAECAGEYRFEESLLAEVRRKVSRLDLPAGLLERIAARLAAPGDEPET